MTLALERPPMADRAGCAADSIDELVRRHLPLVGHLVREVLNRVPPHVNRDDLTSAAMYALVTSARAFDPGLGTAFTGFASIRIRGALTDELRSMDWASRGLRGKGRAVEAARQSLTQALRRTPSEAEVAQVMGVSTKELAGLEFDVRRASVMSLHALSPEDNDELLPSGDEGPESVLLRRERLGYLRDAIAELPDRLRTVVEQYFFGQRKMAEIAAELGVTESRVSQLRSQALAMLRDGMQAADAVDGPHETMTATTATTAATATISRARRDYRSAVASRSTLAGRLSATTVLAESRHPARLARQ